MLKPETIKIQHDLAEYCRTGKAVDIPGTTDGRLPHYRRLVLNVVGGTIAQAYPITRKVLSEEEWNEIFDNFHANHKAQTPILWKLPYEFYLFVAENDYAKKFNKPWLNELLWFEWLEIEIHMMPDQEHAAYRHEGDIFHDLLVINKDSRLIHLEYPLHLYPVAEAELRKGDYYIFIYRDHEDGSVNFVNLSALYAWMLERLLGPDAKPIALLLPELSSRFNLQDNEMLKIQLKKFLQEMIRMGVILGYVISPETRRE